MNGDIREFENLMLDWSAAIVANDPEAIGRFAEPDWVLVGETGIFPREQFLESVATGRITHDSMSHDIHQVRVYGDVAVVLSRGKNTGTFEGKPFRLDEWTTEVLIRRADAWKCSVTHLTSAVDPADNMGGNLLE
ncbi:MAG: nuclear transport factor 2 family protein [Actinobacteria bacterium]|nr:nuclear transport factor 2 family protein [Actinomycetota bacterium]